MKRKSVDFSSTESGCESQEDLSASKRQKTLLSSGYLSVAQDPLESRFQRLESSITHLRRVCELQTRTISCLRVQNEKYASQLSTLRRLVAKQYQPNGNSSHGSFNSQELGPCLMGLPTEIIEHIASFCKFDERLVLRASCTDLNWVVNNATTHVPWTANNNTMMKALRSFPNLLALTVSGTVNALGFKYVTHLKKLRVLTVSNARHLCDDAFSHLTACTSLRQLSVGQAYLFSNHGVSYINQLTWLKKLELSDVINITFPTSPALATNLESLTLRGCVELNVNFDSLSTFTNLVSLCIRSTISNIPFPEKSSSLIFLDCADIDCAQAGQPTSLNFTSSLVSLEKLMLLPWVEEPSQPTIQLSPLTALSGLRTLDLQSSIVEDWGTVSRLTNLQTLAVSANFAEKDVKSLLALPRLTSLTISYNESVDNSLLEKLLPLADKLVYLDLQGCPMISNGIVDYVHNYTKLKYLNLRETAILPDLQLTGPPSVVLADSDDDSFD